DATAHRVLYEGEDFSATGKTTKNYEALRQRCEAFRPGLLIVDNASECFAGNENRRSHVSGFMGALAELVAPWGGTVLLLAHVPKSAVGRKGGESYSGSTAWHNACRNRLALVSTEEDNQTIELRHEKNNFGPRAAPITLRYEGGTLAQVEDTGGLPNSRHEAAIVSLLADFRKRGEPLHVSRYSPSNAYRVLSTEPGWPKGLSRPAFEAAMRSMQRRGLVAVDTKTFSRREVQTWVLQGAAAVAGGVA
ncbi:MAG: AAA family ATPase, partial [Phycisphaerae bacterium]